MWWSISAEGLSVKYLSINRQGICGSSPCFVLDDDFCAGAVVSGSVVSCCVADRAILTIHTVLLHRLVCTNTRDGVVGCVGPYHVQVMTETPMESIMDAMRTNMRTNGRRTITHEICLYPLRQR